VADLHPGPPRRKITNYGWSTSSALARRGAPQVNPGRLASRHGIHHWLEAPRARLHGRIALTSLLADIHGYGSRPHRAAVSLPR
jgi:hypothetical protein